MGCNDQLCMYVLYFQKKKKFEKIFSSFFKAFSKKRRYLADPVLKKNMRKSNIRTYIHNWPLQPFSQDYGLASYTAHVVCSERQIFEELFHGRFIYSQSFCQKSAEKKSPKKYFSYFIFDNWPGIRTQAFGSNKPTHYLLDHGDFERKSNISNSKN